MDTTTDGSTHVRALMRRATGDEKHEESSTSTLDALWVLYDRVLRIDPAAPEAEDRDRFILSKGHGPVALYAILAAKGFFPEDVARRVHGARRPARLAPRPQPSPGSRPRPARSATACPWRSASRWRCAPSGLHEQRVFVLTGDAELNEGSNWEAILLAPRTSGSAT